MHPEEVVQTKGAGKYNFCYAMTNKVPFKATQEEEERIIEEFQLVQLREETHQEVKARFGEHRYLTCGFEVGSFDVYTYTQKTMASIEKEAYKVFSFMEKAFDLRLMNLVTDWVKDDKGNYWFIGVKSFRLREETYLAKTLKPSAFDRELMALNVNKKVHKSKHWLLQQLECSLVCEVLATVQTYGNGSNQDWQGGFRASGQDTSDCCGGLGQRGEELL